MRRILKKHSTKPERIVYEVLKKNHIPFKFRWVLKGREVDFLIGKYILEIGDHKQDSEKNKMLLEEGYQVLQLSNKQIYDKRYKLESFLLKWLLIYLTSTK